jgi:hypothetical protein
MTDQDTLDAIGWDVPGWDWPDNDYSWLEGGITVDGVSVFFIHGGRIRHQAHIPYGYYSVDEFTALLRKYAEGLDNPTLNWVDDTGGGEPGLWLEGTRAPTLADAARLREEREHLEQKDKLAFNYLKRQRPEWFS